MILADFLDPNNNGLDVVDVAYALAAFTAFITGLWAVGRWLKRVTFRVSLRMERWMCAAVEPMIDAKLKDYTYPIQKHANGGKSLPDVARKLDLLLAHLNINPEG